MKCLRGALSKSIVAATYLVFELENKEGVAYGSYIIEPSQRQFYDILRTDVCPHFQIIDRQIEPYISTLKNRGFKLVEGASKLSLNPDCRPTKFYTILESDKNHHLQDVTVVNRF